MLSIIIPTLDEEEYLPTALESIRKQGLTDYEMIVADAGSKDSTVSIARSYGCKVVPGGLPARGRNNGAKTAAGDLFFFLDADTMLPEGLLQKSLEEFSRRKLHVASFPIYTYPDKKSSRLLMEVFYNKMIVVLERVLPHTAVAILVTRESFEKVHGYDESIKLAEDHDLGRRIARFGRFGVLRAGHIFFSDRRFKKEGWFKVGLKYFLCGLHIITIGPVRSDIFRYQFNHYKQNTKKR